jgi:hypothetical protein
VLDSFTSIERVYCQFSFLSVYILVSIRYFLERKFNYIAFGIQLNCVNSLYLKKADTIFSLSSNCRFFYENLPYVIRYYLHVERSF